MTTEEQLIESTEKQEQFEHIYHNIMQVKASLIDANKMIVEAGRASGKTTWFAKRLISVGYDMPGELSFIAHKTYIALISNVLPHLLASFKTPIGNIQRPLMREGIDYVKGVKDLPKHFQKPFYPIENPNHSIILSNGHHLRLVASDQAESVAGANGVHMFVEEMKHNDGAKLKTRIIPALRGGTAATRASHYYQGITGMSDTARVDMGEDDWFTEYEKHTDHKLISEIVSVALHVNKALYRIEFYKQKIDETSDPGMLKSYQEKKEKFERVLRYWSPILKRMRKAASYYIKASSFVNKDMLGFSYFKNELKGLSMDEFLAAIANIRPKKVSDLFFSGFKNEIHTFTDSYTYKSIHEFNLNDTFKLTAEYLKYFDRNKPLVLGYDPGHFCSLVVGQEDRKENTLRILKEFYCWIPKQQGELAQMLYEFFGPFHRSQRLILYYDRAGNKTRIEHEKVVTDARLMASELKRHGFMVEMKNEKQRTIFYYEHFKLLQMILGEKLRSFPRLRIDENECKNLVSSINLSPVLRKDGKIALDKSSEKLAFHLQPALSTQLPSALTYLIFGHYSGLLPKEMKGTSDVISNIVT